MISARKLKAALEAQPQEYQEILLGFMGLSVPTPKEWKVPCAYGSPECKGKKFLPHGCGSTHHTTCEQGKQALASR